MAIVNRDYDASEQLNVLASGPIATASGLSYNAVQVPFPGTLRGLALTAQSISGAPSITVDLIRWTGAGVTTIINVGGSLAVVPAGISASYQLAPIAAGGSTMLNLQAGDVLVVHQATAANVGAAGVILSAVVKATQDIKACFGLSN